jgi:transposase
MMTPALPDALLSSQGLSLKSQRLGPLPILNHFLERLGLESLLDDFVPTRDERTRIPHSKALGVLLRSIILEREPIYRQAETVETYLPRAFGLSQSQVSALSDDSIGRALDRLFAADRGSLLTACVVAAGKNFGLSFKELHNDSTSVRFCGQYRKAQGRSIRGKRAPWITYGYSKDHRRDLKQLLFILTVSVDGNVPVEFRSENGNKSDSKTHLETWEALCKVAGHPKFLYVADSKLCSTVVMEAIAAKGGRFVTVLPRSRNEDKQFRKWIQEFQPTWEKVRDQPNARKKRGPRDIWYTYRSPVPSQESWPVTWVYSTLLREHQGRRRQERIERAKGELDRFKKKLESPGGRKRSEFQIEARIRKILLRLHVLDYLTAWTYEYEDSQFRQHRPGRPGPETKYVKKVRKRLSLSYEVNTIAIEYDMKSDGMYPLLTNDRELSAKEVFEAHKRQPKIEKRFQQLKSVYEIAPVFLKNEARIEALFFLYFLALLVQALVERELRLSMGKGKITSLPLYPEERRSTKPTAETILKLFSHLQRSVLVHHNTVCKTFAPELTALQEHVLELLGVPLTRYTEIT